MSQSFHSIQFPGEGEAYRKALNELLEAEIALRRNIESVAALRRNCQDFEHLAMSLRASPPSGASCR